MDKQNVTQDVELVIEFCKERIEKYGLEVELQSYPTNDGRMKYELYVKEL